MIFSKEVLDRIGLYYDNPDNIEILRDDVKESNDDTTNSIRNEGPNQNNGITEITDYNDKQAAIDNKQDIAPTSNPHEKQSVTDVTNITDPIDAEALDKLGAAGTYSKNIINNSNNLTTPTPCLPFNTPSLSSRCVISVIPLPDKSLDGLPTLSCLFCSTYKTKIRFDMDLHLYEMHKQNLVYHLPIPDSKASIDDRIEYALQLIEQGKIILPNDPNNDR